MNKANVIIITIDECKSSVMSPYGNCDVFTPAAERAACEGALFENAFTCHPKCVPSRCCLLSGRYAHTDGHRTLPGFELRVGEENLASVLKRNGYVTGMFGKNHTFEEDYKLLCFDEFTTQIKGAVKIKAKDTPMKDPMHRAFYRGDWKDTYRDEPTDFYDVEDGISFINRHKDEPFFLLMNLSLPHPVYYGMSPYIEIIREKGVRPPYREQLSEVPEALKSYRKAYDLEMLSDEDWGKIVAAYYSMVSYIDNCVDKIYQSVDKNGIKEKTIVVYTSDHGDFAGEHGCPEKYDTLLYDSLVKIPLFIQYPPLIHKGTRFDSLTENVDVAPTILDLLGLTVPETMHGKSLVPYITGRTALHKDAVFSEGGVEDYALKKAPHYDSPECVRMKPDYYWKQVALVDYPHSMQRSKMVRTHEWKLIYRQNGNKELYNLKEDPLEIRNRVEEPGCREVLYELMEKLIEWLISTEPDTPGIDSLFA